METEGDARPDIVGLERLNIESLPFSRGHRSYYERLPSSPVVYFVNHGGKLLYIGATKNLRKRWASRDYRWLGWVKRKSLIVSWLDINMALLPDAEVFLIKLLSPEFNYGALRYPKSGANRNPTGRNRYNKQARQSTPNGNGHK